MRIKKALISSAAISLFLSAMAHVIDPDVNGVAGLTSPSVLFSVALFSFIPFSLMAGLLTVIREYGFIAGTAALLGGSAVLAAFVIKHGGTAETTSQYIYSFAGLTLILSLLFAAGTILPHLKFARTKKTTGN